MHVVIIGNGAAGLKALETFRKYDKRSSVTIISEEKCMAYSRVLIPYFLRKKVSYENLFICDRDYYSNLGAATHFGSAVKAIDEKSGHVKLLNGKTIKFDRLLIASGSYAVKPPIEGLEGKKVHHMWTLSDAEEINACLKPNSKVLVLGSGFVALQAAWAAVERGAKVTVFELMDQIMPQVLDYKGSKILHQKILEHGVDLRTGVITEKVERNSNGSLTVYAKDKDPLQVDFLIVGTGVRPKIPFIKDTSIEVERGILVDRHMQTNIPGIYAAGDVTQASTVFGENMLCPLWPTAVEQGKIAGANMAGHKIAFTGSLNMNVTQMFGITVASMGKFNDDKLETYELFDEETPRYIKITLKDQVPYGGIVLGDSDDVSILGRIRPLISNHRELEQSPDVLYKELHSKLIQKGNISNTLNKRNV